MEATANDYQSRYALFDLIFQAITNSPGLVGSGQIGSLYQMILELRRNVSQTQLAGSTTAGSLPTTISMESKVLDKQR